MNTKGNYGEAGRLRGTIESNVQAVKHYCDEVSSGAKRVLDQNPSLDRQTRSQIVTALQIAGFLKADVETWYQRIREELEKMGYGALIHWSESIEMGICSQDGSSEKADGGPPTC
jgi:hypothetical protein